MAVDERGPFDHAHLGAGVQRRRRSWLADRSRRPIVAAVAAGGALGAPARYEIGLAVHQTPRTFPWATFWINVSGSFVLGVLLTLVIDRWPPTRFVRPFAAIGFLGAYTTWSTFMVDADLLVKDDHAGVAVVYVIASLVVGLGAVYAGVVAGRIRPRRDGSLR